MRLGSGWTAGKIMTLRAATIAACLVLLATLCLAGSIEDYRKLAEHGDADAQFLIGTSYHEGEGVPRDYVEALTWYRKAADQGHVGALFVLATMQGVPRDYVEALNWFRKSAEQGHASTQSLLGMMYKVGEGVPRDYVEAYMWFSLAAAQGSQTARTQLDAVEKVITPEQRAAAQKLAREWRLKAK
jgi:uncharacterized protein